MDEIFDDCFIYIGFFLFKWEPDIFMLQNGDIYEYIAVYVYELEIA